MPQCSLICGPEPAAPPLLRRASHADPADPATDFQPCAIANIEETVRSRRQQILHEDDVPTTPCGPLGRPRRRQRLRRR